MELVQGGSSEAGEHRSPPIEPVRDGVPEPKVEVGTKRRLRRRILFEQDLSFNLSDFFCAVACAIFRAVEAKNQDSDNPRMLIANTLKGKGVKQLEGNSLCHVRSLSNDEAEWAIQNLR